MTPPSSLHHHLIVSRTGLLDPSADHAYPSLRAAWRVALRLTKHFAAHGQAVERVNPAAWLIKASRRSCRIIYHLAIYDCEEQECVTWQ